MLPIRRAFAAACAIACFLILVATSAAQSLVFTQVYGGGGGSSTSASYKKQRADRADWDATAASEGGARSDASGSTIHSDREAPPLLATESVESLVPEAPRRAAKRLWRRVAGLFGGA